MVFPRLVLLFFSCEGVVRADTAFDDIQTVEVGTSGIVRKTDGEEINGGSLLETAETSHRWAFLPTRLERLSDTESHLDVFKRGVAEAEAEFLELQQQRSVSTQSANVTTMDWAITAVGEPFAEALVQRVKYLGSGAAGSVQLWKTRCEGNAEVALKDQPLPVLMSEIKKRLHRNFHEFKALRGFRGNPDFLQEYASYPDPDMIARTIQSDDPSAIVDYAYELHHKGLLYETQLVTEVVEGGPLYESFEGTLKQWIVRGALGGYDKLDGSVARLKARKALIPQILLTLVRGVYAMAAKDLVHRDIKSANILVDGDIINCASKKTDLCRFVIADMGLVCSSAPGCMQKENNAICCDHIKKGTPMKFPPDWFADLELLKQQPHLHAAHDLWSIGVLLWDSYFMVESDSRHFLWIHVKEVEQLYTCLREIGGGKGAEDWVRDTLKKRKSFSGLQYTEALFDKCLLNFGPGSDRPDDMFIDIMQMLMERSPRKRMSHILNSDGTWNKDETSLWGMAHAYYEQKVGSQAVQRVVSPLSSCFETAATCNFWREFVTRSYFCGMGVTLPTVDGVQCMSPSVIHSRDGCFTTVTLVETMGFAGPQDPKQNFLQIKFFRLEDEGGAVPKPAGKLNPGGGLRTEMYGSRGPFDKFEYFVMEWCAPIKSVMSKKRCDLQGSVQVQWNDCQFIKGTLREWQDKNGVYWTADCKVAKVINKGLRDEKELSVVFNVESSNDPKCKACFEQKDLKQDYMDLIAAQKAQQEAALTASSGAGRQENVDVFANLQKFGANMLNGGNDLLTKIANDVFRDTPIG